MLDHAIGFDEELRQSQDALFSVALYCHARRIVNVETVYYRGEPDGFMGFADNRVKFYGHGVGLDLDEMPVLADRIDVALKEGMILAVEPKAFLAGSGPVGVENTYVITADGCESFCPLELGLKPVP